MRIEKKMAAAIGLIAALAGPAAAEVNLNGFVRIKPYVSNTATPFSNWSMPVANSPTGSFVDERARLKFTVGNENVKGVAFFEFDQTWGDSAYANGRNLGGGLEADTGNLETKNLYIWFKVPDSPIDLTAGVQNQTDAYAGVFFGGADFAGVVANAKVDPAALRLGWAKFWENDVKKADDVDLYLVEARWSPAREVALGASLYFINDQGKGVLGPTSPAGVGATFGGSGAKNPTKPSEFSTGYRNLKLYAPGVNGALDFGAAKLTGFFLYEFGKVTDARSAALPSVHDVDMAGYAADLRAEGVAGPARAFLEAIYVSGDRNVADGKYRGFTNASSYNGVAATYTRTDTYILMPNADDITTATSLANDVANGGAGVFHVAAGAVAEVAPRTNVKVGAGYLAAAQKRATRDIATQSLSYNFAREKAMGTELNLVVSHNLSKGLDLGIVGAYCWLGGAFKVPGQPEPDDLYDIHARLNYAF